MTTEEKIEHARNQRAKLLAMHAEYIEKTRRMFFEFARKIPALSHYLETGEVPSDPVVLAGISEQWEAIARNDVQQFNAAFFEQWIHTDLLEIIPELCKFQAKEGTNNE